MSTKELSPGGGGTIMPATYDYDGPAYTLKDQGEVPVEAFVGYQWAWEDAASGQRRTETQFYHTMSGGHAHPHDPRKGKVLTTKTGKYVSPNWQEYTWTSNTYTEYDHAAESDWPADVHFDYLSQVVAHACANGACQTQKTTYAYDPAAQGGRQYGNVTEIKEYANETDPNPYRTTRRWYNVRHGALEDPPVDVYLVDRVKSEGVYAGSGWTDQATTWYYYDNYASSQAPLGTKGELWAVQQLLDRVEDSTYITWQAAETRYVYDAYGNATQATQYAGYGQVRYTKATGVATRTLDPSLPRTTTTEYETGLYTLPWRVTNAVGLREERYYYHVNDAPTDAVTGSGLPGQLKRVRDVENDAQTWSTYDAFGRPAKVVHPYDTENMSTVEYQYVDNYQAGTFRGGKRTEILREISADSGAVQVNFSYYDGLGRVVETLTERTNGAEQVLAYRTYDALGRVDKAYVPYVVNTDFWNYKPVDTARPGTTTAYDALDRPVQVTQPDDTLVKTAYRGGERAPADTPHR